MIICDSEHAVQPTCSTFQFVFISSRTPCAAVMEFSLGNYAISNNALFRDKDYALVGIQSIKSSVTCTNTSIAAISRFLCLWFSMSLHNVYGWPCNPFLGIFTAC